MPTVTIQPDSSTAQDTYVDVQNATSSYYTDTQLKVGRNSYSCSCGTCCNTCSTSSCSYCSANTCTNICCGCNSCSQVSCPTCGTNCGSCINNTSCPGGCTGGCGGGGCGCPAGKHACRTCASCSFPNCFVCGNATCTSGACCGCGPCTVTNCTACGSYSCNCSTCYQGTFQSFIKFDVTSIPVDAIITSATLTLTRSSGSGNVDVHRVTSSWAQTTVSWNARPSWDSTFLDQTSVTSGANDWDVTSAMQGWINGSYTNYGLAVKTPSDTDAEKYFYAAEYSTAGSRPKLVVAYELPMKLGRISI